MVLAEQNLRRVWTVYLLRSHTLHCKTLLFETSNKAECTMGNNVTMVSV